MTQAGDPTRHFWLTQGVARALGLNFTEAMLCRRLTEADFAALVESCRLCERSGACIVWLGRHGAGSPRAPDFCMNRNALETLARTH